MKKMLSIVLCLVMLAVSACAFAEPTTVMTYDPSIFEALGIEVQTIEIGDFGLKFDIPAEMIAQDVTEEQFMAGAMAIYATEDLSVSMSVDFLQLFDAEGNPIADFDTLMAYYTEMGAEYVEMVDVNGYAAMSCVLPEADVIGVIFLEEGGWLLGFSFTPASTEGVAELAAASIATIRDIEEPA